MSMKNLTFVAEDCKLQLQGYMVPRHLPVGTMYPCSCGTMYTLDAAQHWLMRKSPLLAHLQIHVGSAKGTVFATKECSQMRYE